MEKLYIIKIAVKESGRESIFSHAFTNEENALYYAKQYNIYNDHIRTATVEEIELPFIGRSICYVHGYYSICRGSGVPMHHMSNISQVYSCVADAKHDPIWQNALKSVEEHPEVKYHVADSMIATTFDWSYGGFNVSVKRIRVIKAGVDYNKHIDR